MIRAKGQVLEEISNLWKTLSVAWRGHEKPSQVRMAYGLTLDQDRKSSKSDRQEMTGRGRQKEYMVHLKKH